LSSAELVFRDTDIVTLAELGREFIRPERLRIKLSDEVRAAPVDIGSLAYSVRKEPGWKMVVSGKPVMVDPNSLQECRRELIKVIVDSFFISGLREKSILLSCKNYKYVLDWCDGNGFSGVFSSVDATRSAYLAYSDYLRDQVLVKKALKPLTCAGRQSMFVQLIELMFSGDAAHITHGVPSIRGGARNSPEPPREDDVKKYVNVCIDLANKFSEFVLEGESFPLNTQCAGQKVVVFPSMSGLLTPLTIGSSSVNDIYNYAEGRLATIEEYVEISGYFRSVCARGLSQAEATIVQANKDLRHQQRIRLASLAINSYVCLFGLLTGASPTELRQFDHVDALEIEKSLVKREFSAVKFRAGGAKTRYAIGRGKGLQLLKEYLKLRAWLLNGQDFKYLFFSLERKGSYTGGFKKLNPIYSNEFHEKIKGVFLPANFNCIAPSRGRKLKSLVLHELKFTPEQVASSLNHRLKMNLDGYAETTVDRYEKEFDLYWRAVRRAGERIRERAGPNESSTVVGHCDEMDHPVQLEGTVPIQPDCRTQYGCLYCVHYVCHADEEDVHKLTSLQYVINAIRNLAADMNHADRLFRDLSVRIEFLLDEISKLSDTACAMVNAVKRRVFDLGELTPFWENRLQRYEMMGVVF